MSRTQISLSPELHSRAKQRAGELGVSFSELTRRALEEAIGEEPRPRVDIAAIFNLGRSGGSDIAKHKDEYIGEAVEHEYLRQMGRRPNA